jgi:hypothetical protein
MNKGGPAMSFNRRVNNSSIFILTQTNDICEAETEDIVAILLEPIECRKGCMILLVKFYRLHVCQHPFPKLYFILLSFIIVLI